MGSLVDIFFLINKQRNSRGLETIYNQMLASPLSSLPHKQTFHQTALCYCHSLIFSLALFLSIFIYWISIIGLFGWWVVARSTISKPANLEDVTFKSNWLSKKMEHFQAHTLCWDTMTPMINPVICYISLIISLFDRHQPESPDLHLYVWSGPCRGFNSIYDFCH